MEEFKTAHSKMFNRLRQARNNESRQSAGPPDKRDGANDEDELRPNDADRGDDDDAKTAKISSSTNLANLRPRPTVATN
jgi:hypothetical protein